MSRFFGDEEEEEDYEEDYEEEVDEEVTLGSDELKQIEDQLYRDEDPVKLNSDFSNAVVIDNVPIVSEEKHDKLLKVLRNKMTPYGEVVEIYLPQDKSGSTVGYAFVEFTNPDSAREAVSQEDGKKLDKVHTLKVTPFTEFERLAKVTEEFVPTADEFKAKDDKYNWLLDPQARDQYVVRYEWETEIYWNDPVHSKKENGRKLVNNGEIHKSKGKTWTDGDVTWSPKGTYLTTFHNQGVALWGGDQFERLGRFTHRSAREIDFSPNETYAITYSYPMANKAGLGEPEGIVWDCIGNELRKYEVGPKFVWSFDEKYIARSTKNKKGNDAICVYELPEMNLLDKKSFEINNVRDVQWSPTQNILSFWVPEEGSTPCRVTLMEIPSRKIVREKHLYSVSDVTMHWQSDGDFLCVKMNRVKNKKATTNLEIFRLREKDIPVESLEIDGKVIALDWEPNGQRFTVTIEASGARNNINIYAVRKKKIEFLKQLPGRPVNKVLWSPEGNVLALVGLDSFNGVMEFVDTNTTDTIAIREHYRCTEVCWDPTGRFFTSAIVQPLLTSGFNKTQTLENGYKIWAYDSKGGQMFDLTTEVQLAKCYRILWRPRLPCPLSRDKQRNIKKTLKEKYEKAFIEEDERDALKNRDAAQQRRDALMQEWREYRKEKRKEYLEQSEIRKELRDGVASDAEDDYQTIEETVDVVLDEQEFYR